MCYSSSNAVTPSLRILTRPASKQRESAALRLEDYGPPVPSADGIDLYLSSKSRTGCCLCLVHANSITRLIVLHGVSPLISMPLLGVLVAHSRSSEISNILHASLLSHDPPERSERVAVPSVNTSV